MRDCGGQGTMGKTPKVSVSPSQRASCVDSPKASTAARLSPRRHRESARSYPSARGATPRRFTRTTSFSAAASPLDCPRGVRQRSVDLPLLSSCDTETDECNDAGRERRERGARTTLERPLRARPRGRAAMTSAGRRARAARIMSTTEGACVSAMATLHHDVDSSHRFQTLKTPTGARQACVPGALFPARRWKGEKSTHFLLVIWGLVDKSAPESEKRFRGAVSRDFPRG